MNYVINNPWEPKAQAWLSKLNSLFFLLLEMYDVRESVYS